MKVRAKAGHVRTILAMAVLSSLAACSSEAPNRPALKKYGSPDGAGVDGGSGDGTSNGIPPVEKPEVLATKIALGLGAIAQDPVAYTFGALEVTSKNVKASPIKISRFLSVSKPADLKAEQKSELLKLCRDIELSQTADKIETAEEAGNSKKPFYLFWRSYYPGPVKAVLSDLITAGQDVHCVVKVEAKDDDKLTPYFIAFDPAPADAKLVLGGPKAANAIAQGLMLPLAKENQSFSEATLIAADAKAEILIGVQALAKENIKITPETNTAACTLHPSKAGVVLNPTAVFASKASLESEMEVSIGKISPAAVDGRILKSCEALMPKQASLKLEAGLSCEIYQKIKNEGIEAGCQWDVEVLNGKDPANSVSARFALDKVKYNTFNVKQVDLALANIPKSPRNPVVTKAINFKGFNEKQLKSMEQMFDLWLAVEVKSYDEDVEGFMKNITRSACDSGILGFAGIRSANFTICDLAALTDSALNKTDDPLRPIIQLITTSHEVRHAVKWYHDFDDPEYAPCGGTAASAVTMHAVAAKCDLDYCLVLKNMALREFRAELNYSLKNDRRKSEGICKTWTDELGVNL